MHSSEEIDVARILRVSIRKQTKNDHFHSPSNDLNAIYAHVLSAKNQGVRCNSSQENNLRKGPRMQQVIEYCLT